MKKFILCADDYGQNSAISQAIITLLGLNRLTAVSCMTTASDWHQHAVAIRPFKDQADIGLHFNLTEGVMPLSRLMAKAYLRLLDRKAIEADFNAQLDAFVEGVGQLPHFIDGHQHVHQLPVIRDVILQVYDKRLRSSQSYIRCAYQPDAFYQMHQVAYVKNLIIQLLGAGQFKKELVRYDIPHTTSFSGVYQFADAARYADIFPRFLNAIGNRGMIMCHPGLQSDDVIGAARFCEFQYLNSPQFLQDCAANQAVLSRFKS